MERRWFLRSLGATTAILALQACGALEKDPVSRIDSTRLPEKDLGFGKASLILPEKPNGDTGVYALELNKNSLEENRSDTEDIGGDWKLQLTAIKTQEQKIGLTILIKNDQEVKTGWTVVLSGVDIQSTHTIKTIWSDWKFTEALFDDKRLPKTDLP